MMNSGKEVPWIADIAYGVSEAGHKWAESMYNHASSLYLDADFEEAFKIDDVSSVFHYEPIAKLDKLSSNMTEHNDECCVSNGLLCEDEITNLSLAVCFPKVSEDHNLDVDLAKKVPEIDFTLSDEELNFGSSRSVNCPDYLEMSNEVVEVSELFVPLPKRLRSTACEMHDVVGSNIRYETVCEDGMHLSCSEDRMTMKCSIVTDTDNIYKTNDELFTKSDQVSLKNRLTEECSSMNRYSTNDPFGEKVVRTRPKRLCHPPNKYEEGSAVSKPRQGRPKKYCKSSSKDKDLGAISQKKCHGKSSKCIATKVSERHMELESDDDYKPNKSHFKTKKSHFKSKKCNKQWTLDEVINLVDGIAHFGQGRWTFIKKTFFTSSFRTPTDIRDKWRNLVTANCRILKRKRKHPVNGSVSLPSSIIERVRELVKTIPSCRSEHEGKFTDSRI